MLDELERRVLVEQGNRVDRLEASEDVSSFAFRADRAIRALEAPNAGVAIEADDQGVAARARATQEIEMAGMEKVEHAIGEDDAARLVRSPGVGAFPVENLPRRVEATQKLVSTRGRK